MMKSSRKFQSKNVECQTVLSVYKLKGSLKKHRPRLLRHSECQTVIVFGLEDNKPEFDEELNHVDWNVIKCNDSLYPSEVTEIIIKTKEIPSIGTLKIQENKREWIDKLKAESFYIIELQIQIQFVQNFYKKMEIYSKTNQVIINELIFKFTIQATVVIIPKLEVKKLKPSLWPSIEKFEVLEKLIEISRFPNNPPWLTISKLEIQEKYPVKPRVKVLVRFSKCKLSWIEKVTSIKSFSCLRPKSKSETRSNKKVKKHPISKSVTHFKRTSNNFEEIDFLIRPKTTPLSKRQPIETKTEFITSNKFSNSDLINTKKIMLKKLDLSNSWDTTNLGSTHSQSSTSIFTDQAFSKLCECSKLSSVFRLKLILSEFIAKSKLKPQAVNKNYSELSLICEMEQKENCLSENYELEKPMLDLRTGLNKQVDVRTSDSLLESKLGLKWKSELEYWKPTNFWGKASLSLTTIHYNQ